jgi:hypothetical protein
MHISWTRITEPSTWAGFAGILQGLKLLLPHYASVLDGLTMAAGTVAALRADPANR